MVLSTAVIVRLDDDQKQQSSSSSLLHTSLLRGNLSIVTQDVDIRRRHRPEDWTFTNKFFIPIETDYILQIAESSSLSSSSTATTTPAAVASSVLSANHDATKESGSSPSSTHVHFDEHCKCAKDDYEYEKYNNYRNDNNNIVSTTKTTLFETYHISKRYVDLRNLASALQSHAEDIVKYYARANTTTTTNTTSMAKEKGTNASSESKTTTTTSSTLYDSLEKWAIHKPIEAVKFLTNTESNTSHLVSTLDSISKNKNNNNDKNTGSPTRRHPTTSLSMTTSTTTTTSASHNNNTKSALRSSTILHRSSPPFVRHILLGIDHFYESIYSEKRQFGTSKKTKKNLEYITKVSERRRKIIDSAFYMLMKELSHADEWDLQQQQQQQHSNYSSSTNHNYIGGGGGGGGRSSNTMIPIPVPLFEKLFATLEKFLLTDVLVDSSSSSSSSSMLEGDTTSSTTITRATRSSSPMNNIIPPVVLPNVAAAVMEFSDTPSSHEYNDKTTLTATTTTTSTSNNLNSSMIQPMSTTRRASVVDRTNEMSILLSQVDAGNFVLEDSPSDDEEEDDNVVEMNGNVTTRLSLGSKEAHGLAGAVLPTNPTDFAILIGIGTICLKVLEGHVLMVPLDIMIAFGIVCGLMGYRMAVQSLLTEPIMASFPPQMSHYNDDGMSIRTGDENTAQNQYTAPNVALPMGESSTDQAIHRSSYFTTSSTSTSNSLSIVDQQHSPKSLRLLRKSISSFRAMVLGEEEIIEEKHFPAAKTFPKFPDGATIGSHHNCWSSPPSSNFQVRGYNYLKDKEKIPSKEYLFPCRGCDLFLTDTAPMNVGRNRSILGGKLRDVPTFIINYRLPWGVFLSYHEIPTRFLPFLRRGQGYGGDASTTTITPLPSMMDMSGGERAVCNFFLSSDEEKNQVFKIVPMVVEGPWVVKRVVGGKPAIIGKKLPISYVYQPPEEEHSPQGHNTTLAEYFEADLDIVSSAAARNILAVVRSYTQVLTIDLGFVVQGNTTEELPEQMMLGLRLHGLDPLTAELLPVFEDGTTMLERDNEE